MSAPRLPVFGVRLRASALGRSERGYSLVEMLVSVAIMTTVTGAIFRMAGSSQSGFRTQPEVADMQQRLRVAADMIYKDLVMAGAGPTFMNSGSLAQYFPPISPARRGAQNADAELFFAADRISIVYAARSRAQSVLSADQSSAGADLAVDTSYASCPSAVPCGFATGMRTLILDAGGVGAGYDLFNVTGTTATDVAHGSPNPAFSKVYLRSTARLLAAEHHVYFLDSSTKKLMHYDGHQSLDELVDNVVALQFTYYADPDPNSAPEPMPGLSNCLYDAASPPVAKLTNLGGTALKALTAAQLTDGPTCGVAPNRFDGDLLRVRKVRVHIKVQVGREDLRGTSTDFAIGGKSTGGQKYVPDYGVTFEVTPRNLNLIR